MKKSILSLTAGVIAALASCSQPDEMPGQPQEGVQPATFTIRTPAATRSDATVTLTRFIIEAYEGATATGTPAVRAEAVTGTLTLTLKKNMEYTFLFWADGGTAKDESAGTPGSGYWDAADLKAVTVTDGKESITGEAAYCIATTFNSAEFEANKAVTLRNATAQVNFVEAAGLTAADNNTLAVTYSAGTALNVATGKVTEVTGTIIHTFTGIGQVSANTILATDYILAPKGEQRVTDLTLKLNDETPKTLTNVPFEQCYVTNIKGEYSTLGMFSFTIEADNAWTMPDNDCDLSWDGKYPADVAEAKAWLGTESEGDADGKNHVFTISTAKQLCAIHYLVEQSAVLDNATTNAYYSFAHYKLTANINLGNHLWTPIGTSEQKPFRGTFDGCGYYISGLYVNATTTRAGLFGEVNAGTVRNLRVSGSVKSTDNNAGGIIGRLHEGCSVENCIFDGNARGFSGTGGIVGYAMGKTSRIAGCYAKGSITATSQNAGGIAGTCGGRIDDCYSEADVEASIYRAGGIAGFCQGSGVITRCYATGSISCEACVGGIVGTHNGSLANCIALSPRLTRTSGSDTEFGRIAGRLASDGTSEVTYTSCAAFAGMTITDATGTTITPGAISIAGDDLTAAECLSADTYTSLGFIESWAFGSDATWTYLPWNPAFGHFPGIRPGDYRIAVPDHLKSTVQ